MFRKLYRYRYMETKEHNQVSGGKHTLGDINNNGKEECLKTWQQKVQSKHIGKRNQSKSKQSFNELQGNNKQQNTCN